MKVIAGPRQSGKTTKAIELANEKGATLVVHSRGRAEQVKNNYPDVEEGVVSVSELERNRARGNNGTYVIDDLDMMLSKILGHAKAVGITMTADGVEALSTAGRDWS